MKDGHHSGGPWQLWLSVVNCELDGFIIDSNWIVVEKRYSVHYSVPLMSTNHPCYSILVHVRICISLS